MRYIHHLRLETGATILKPAQAGIGRGNAEAILRQPPDRAIVHNFAIIIAPGTVEDLTDPTARDIARHDAIHNCRRLRAYDVILEQGRDVDERGRIADSEVLTLVSVLVSGGGPVARPFAPLFTLVQFGSAGVERSRNWHADLECIRNFTLFLWGSILDRVL